MGDSEDGKPSKPEKSASPAMEQNNIHVYPDWATMQAYYGPRLAVPPYLNSAVASPHAPPPYMWAPLQHMIPAPYAAFYAHGGIYAHPGVPIGGGASLSMDHPQVKSSGNTDGGFMKKLKEFDGLAISMGNTNGERGTAHGSSESEETEGSSDGSNGVTAAAGQSVKKRSRQGSPNSGEDKAQTKSSSFTAAEVGRGSENTMIHPAMKTVEKTSTLLQLKDSCDQNLKLSKTTSIPQSSMSSEAWLQNEREIKRERRKQSNRESARRSRLRKQAEIEELATRVQTLISENLSLKSEMNQLMESSKKLRLENATLTEKLKDGAPMEEVKNIQKIDDLELKPVGTVNLLARVNDNGSTNEECESYESKSPKTKLHQLLDSSPRTDAVAAG